jgi:hypothetical protein
MSSFVSRNLLLVSIVGTMGSLAIALPAGAAAIDFTTWSATGNTTAGIGTASLATNPNSTDAIIPTLQDFLGLNPTDLDNGLDQAFQGSGLETSFNAGDTISFSYDFSLFTSNLGSDLDYAFVVNNGVVEQLLGVSGTYSKTFTAAGLFGIGVVDVNDTVGASTLSISNANFTPVPTPALLPGIIGLGVSVLRKRVKDR